MLYHRWHLTDMYKLFIILFWLNFEKQNCKYVMTDYLNESATAYDSHDCAALVLWGYRVKHINIQLILFQSNSINIMH